MRRKGPGDLVLTSPGGAVLRSGNFRRRVFDPAARAADLDDLSPHDLRHTAASLLVASGANVKAVQRMLGRASAAMTLDVYSGLFDDASARWPNAWMPHMTPTRLREPWAPCGLGNRSSKSTIDTQAVDLRLYWWGGWGSNPRPRDYESPALTG